MKFDECYDNCYGQWNVFRRGNTYGTNRQHMYVWVGWDGYLCEDGELGGLGWLGVYVLGWWVAFCVGGVMDGWIAG